MQILITAIRLQLLCVCIWQVDSRYSGVMLPLARRQLHVQVLQALRPWQKNCRAGRCTDFLCPVGAACQTGGGIRG